MIKHLSQISGVAAFAVIAATASADIKINDNLFIDGYATASGVVTEPSPGVKDKVLLNSGRVFDSAKIALNGKYEDFTAKVSGLAVDGDQNTLAKGGGDPRQSDFGLLDAYITYKTGDVSVTAGKFIGWLGYESFDTPNNAFISFSQLNYISPYATGLKTEYIVKDYSTGVSVRDSASPYTKFYQGDGEYKHNLGYEAYFLYTGIDKLQVFAGAGYQNKYGNTSPSSPLIAQVATFDVWASYALSDKLTLAAEYASVKDATSFSWLTQASYAVTTDWSVAARLTGSDSSTSGATATAYSENSGVNSFGYGLASTYTVCKNFSVKAEVNKTELNYGGVDGFEYALQGVLKF